MRQRVIVGIHLSEEHGEFRPHLNSATPDQPISRVDIVDGLSIQSDDPKILGRLSGMFAAAAAAVRVAREEQDRRDAADDMQRDAEADAHAEAQALGYHDDECRATIEHDAMVDEIAAAQR